ncbi:MAG TPA: hypothetical protein VLB49_10220 [Gemmatimonadales bacterium]|nr:hypothetical protein [Gemmatimonadales bacterium]
MAERRRREPLSRAGAARREMILAAATAAQQRRLRRRSARRLFAVAAVCCLAAAVADRAVRPWRPGPAPPPTGSELAGGRSAADRPRIIVVSGTHRSGRVRPVGDDELVRFLHEIDRPAGLVREGDSVRLTRSVADEAIE